MRTARTAWSTTRPCRLSPCWRGLANSGLVSSSLSNAQEPEVFADLQQGRSAFSLNWPYVLSAMREANPDLVPDLGFAPYPTVDRVRRPPRRWAG